MAELPQFLAGVLFSVAVFEIVDLQKEPLEMRIKKVYANYKASTSRGGSYGR
jgi:hypothetical protein